MRKSLWLEVGKKKKSRLADFSSSVCGGCGTCRWVRDGPTGSEKCYEKVKIGVKRGKRGGSTHRPFLSGASVDQEMFTS